MSGRVIRPSALAALAAVQLGCPQRQLWQYDESHRIGEVMSSERFADDLAAKGTAFVAPPSAAAPLPASNYQLQPAAPKKRTKSQRSSRSTKRHGRATEEVTSAAAEEGSVSRRP